MRRALPPRRTGPERRAWCAAALLGVLWLVAGCTSGSPGSSAARSTPEQSSATAPSTSTATATRSPAPGSASGHGQGLVVLRLSSRFDASVTFQSPSGNLACRLSDGVMCRAKAHTWTSHAQEPQTECPVARRTSGIELGSAAPAERSDCYDQAEDPTLVLAYGHGLELDGVRCISEQRGITCRRTRDHVGFSISRTALSHTPWDSPLLQVPARTLDHHRTTVFPAGFAVVFAVPELADCLLDADRASCLVNSTARGSYQDPTCEFDQALTARVEGKGRGRLVYDCRSDANGGQDLVRSGEAVQVGDLRCGLTGRRLRCAHLAGSRHGFVVDATSFHGY